MAVQLIKDGVQFRTQILRPSRDSFYHPAVVGGVRKKENKRQHTLYEHGNMKEVFL